LFQLNKSRFYSLFVSLRINECVLYVVDFNIYAIFVYCMSWISIFTLYLCVVCCGFQYLRYNCVLFIVDFIFTLYLCILCRGFQYLRFICVLYVVDFNIYAIIVCCLSWNSICTLYLCVVCRGFQ